MAWITSGIVLTCLGIVFIVDPSQFLVNNEIIAKKVNSGSSLRRVFRIFGFMLLGSGIFCILYSL